MTFSRLIQFNRLASQRFTSVFQLIRMAHVQIGRVRLPELLDPSHQNILNKDALDFLINLHERFNPVRLQLLEQRKQRMTDIAKQGRLDFLPQTATIRDDKGWKIAPLPVDLQKRRVEITGPVDRKMIINALNSGADCFMADFEDSNAPLLSNQLNGQVNLKDAINRKIDFTANGKKYSLKEKVATLLVRPRGWHLPEKHLLVNEQQMSGSLVDFGLFFFHNANTLVVKGSGPYFYLPKMESHLEARLWNQVFEYSQKQLGLPNGTIKATCLVETLPAAFEMDEILYELREHSAGLNAGRWDYIFSCIKCMSQKRTGQPFVLADRHLLTMRSPFMRAYALQLIRTCHQRSAPAIGGMSALIPIRDNPEANAKALEGVREDKRRDAHDGFDGGWVAHPGLVALALEQFEQVLKGRPNQIEVKREDVPFCATDLQMFEPRQPITENGVRVNASVAIQYLSSWLTGNGCVPINNLMEDAATAEISRTQLWNWLQAGVRLDTGIQLTEPTLRRLVEEELHKVIQSGGKSGKSLPYEKAAQLMLEQVCTPNPPAFLTLPLYNHL